MATTAFQPGLVNLFTTQFSTNIELLLQQMGSLLRGKIREGFHVGKMASPINQIGAISSQAPAGRFAPLQRVDANLVRRWVFPQERELPQLVDQFDEYQTVVDPKSMYAQNTAMAFGRDWDDAIIAAFFGTAQTGQDAANLTGETASTTTYGVSDTFGSSASTGLTVAKIIEARRIMRHYHVDVDTDPLSLLIGSKQESDLLQQVQVVSTEFADRPILTNGKLTQFLGFDITVSERLSPGTASLRQCYAWAKSGMYLGMWKDMEVQMDRRIDLSSQPWQIYAKHMYGATRTQLGKVIQILAADTTGADITP
jgi:hypothetical protein